MEKIDPILPEWISRQASIGANVEVDSVHDRSDNNNQFWYLLTVCCPLIFEKYAIVLHSFGVNKKVKDLVEKGYEINDEMKNASDFVSLTWEDFFRLYNKSFSLETAVSTKEQISEELLEDKWPDHVWFPGEGNLENLQLTAITNTIKDIYGDRDVNYYYCLLKLKDWTGDEAIYKGKLSELEKLWHNQDIRGNPTAIFPDTKEWCVISDFDLPYSYIGGSAKLIDKLKELKGLDIFPITPMFGEKKHSD